jgi:hypothetical protein
MAFGQERAVDLRALSHDSAYRMQRVPGGMGRVMLPRAKQHHFVL